VPKPEPLAGPSEGKGFVAGAVIGHDALDGDAEVRIVGDSGLKEGDGAALALALHDPAEGNPRGVVDGDVDELPTDAAAVALAGTVAGDPVAGPIELTELFDVDVDELAGLIALVAARWFGRLEGAQPIEAQALEHPADSGGRDTGFDGDRLAGQALAAQSLDAIDRGLGCRLT